MKIHNVPDPVILVYIQSEKKGINNWSRGIQDHNTTPDQRNKGNEEWTNRGIPEPRRKVEDWRNAVTMGSISVQTVGKMDGCTEVRWLNSEDWAPMKSWKRCLRKKKVFKYNRLGHRGNVYYTVLTFPSKDSREEVIKEDSTDEVTKGVSSEEINALEWGASERWKICLVSLLWYAAECMDSA